MINIFIPSYHRWENLKTVNYFIKIGWKPELIHVVIDNEADDIKQYKKMSEKKGFKLHIFEQKEARERYDYVHRASISRRSAGQARNMFYDIAKNLNIEFYMVQDDDTQRHHIRYKNKNIRKANKNDIVNTFEAIKEFMYKRRIGCFGLSQSGDFYGGTHIYFLRKKIMNTTFVLTKYLYRGEKGVQDNDTSQFVGMMNEGFFTYSLGDGLVLEQTPSVSAKGGLTDLYKECKLLNKSLVTPIQFPSAIIAEKQKMNGGRLHHRIKNRYLYPRLLKGTVRSNIAWDTYPEDYPFTNEPKR